MKINFDQEMKTIDGQPLTNETQTEEGKKLKTKITLKTVAVNALLASFPDEQSLSGEDKAKRYVLATRIYANSGADLSLEDVVLIKRLIGKGFGPLVVGPAFQLLEGSAS